MRASRRVGSMVCDGVRGELVSRFSCWPSAAITMSATSPLMTTSASNTTAPIFVPAASSSRASRVGLVGGQQRQLRQRRAEQRCRYQCLAQLLEYDRSIGELAAGAAEILGHHQCGSTDLLAQQLPQRLVVAVLRRHRLRAPRPAKHASRPARRRCSRSSSRSSLTTPPEVVADAAPDRPTPSAAPAPATATATCRALG